MGGRWPNGSPEQLVRMEAARNALREGLSVAQAARIAGVTRQTVYNWLRPPEPIEAPRRRYKLDGDTSGNMGWTNDPGVREWLDHGWAEAFDRETAGPQDTLGVTDV